MPAVLDTRVDKTMNRVHPWRELIKPSGIGRRKLHGQSQIFGLLTVNHYENILYIYGEIFLLWVEDFILVCFHFMSHVNINRFNEIKKNFLNNCQMEFNVKQLQSGVIEIVGMGWWGQCPQKEFSRVNNLKITEGDSKGPSRVHEC